MRGMLVSVALALGIAVPLTAAAETPAASPPKVVYLYGQSSLDELRSTNPLHYARAVKIIAAAPQLCRFSTPEVIFAAFEARDVHCARGMFKTSYPPKWTLDFRLDAVSYVALVTVTGLHPHLLPAR